MLRLNVHSHVASFNQSKCLILAQMTLAQEWSSLAEGDEGYIGPSDKLLCL